MCVFTLIVLV